MKIRVPRRPVVAKPWSIQLEVVEGCNYSCWFCGIHSVRSNKTPGTGWADYREMPVELVRAMFKETRRWLNGIRVELDNHGEPTLHHDFQGILQAIRLDPKAHIQLQTNGSQIEDWPMFEKFVKASFRNGLNLLAINAYKRWGGKPQDGYEKKSRYQMFMAYAKQYAELHTIDRVIDHYYDNPDHMSIYRRYPVKMHQIFVLDDLGEVNTKKRKETGRPVSKDINNEAGNSPEKTLHKLLGIEPMTEPLEKKCTRPFRELNMGYNGVVPVCCYDWSTQLPVGKFPDSSLQDIWESIQMNAIRELLIRKNRHMTPCSKCSYAGGWRQGLLKAPGLKESDEELQEVVTEHMKTMRQYVFAGNGVDLPSKLVQIADQVIPLASLRRKKNAD
jgi:MoaA/NifB/PqqE/SkfB family radical SAM enzyme